MQSNQLQKKLKEVKWVFLVKIISLHMWHKFNNTHKLINLNTNLKVESNFYEFKWNNYGSSSYWFQKNKFWNTYSLYLKLFVPMSNLIGNLHKWNYVRFFLFFESPGIKAFQLYFVTFQIKRTNLYGWRKPLFWKRWS